jgi:septum site-determining protein MinC
MSATNGSDKASNSENKAGTFSANSGPAEAVRSKIAALLDNVTVNGGAPNPASASATASSSLNLGTPAAKLSASPVMGLQGPSGETTSATGRENGATYSVPFYNSTPPSVVPPVTNAIPPVPPLPAPQFSGPPLGTPPDHNRWSTSSLNALPPHTQPSSNADANTRDQGLNQAINIKGRTDGVAIEIGKGNWAELLVNLTERLAQSSDFFRGGRVALDIGARPLMESELQELHDLLEKMGLKLGAVRTKSELTFQAALNLGLATRLEPGGDAERGDAQPAAGNREAEQYFVYRGNLRSGQILQKREHILVIGDVNPGAEVISAGDIFVWGRLRGIAHAGADGDARAVIVAFELDPVQLQIVDVPGSAPEEPTGFAARLFKKRTKVKRPEIAYLHNHQMIIEPWDESRPGGIAAFRR